MLLLVLLPIFGPIPFLILGVASLYALVTVGLPIVAALLLVGCLRGSSPVSPPEQIIFALEIQQTLNRRAMSMARRTRKQLVGKVENEEITLREEQVRTLRQ